LEKALQVGNTSQRSGTFNILSEDSTKYANDSQGTRGIKKKNSDCLSSKESSVNGDPHIGLDLRNSSNASAHGSNGIKNNPQPVAVSTSSST
jgi:hypothetical protein